MSSKATRTDVKFRFLVSLVVGDLALPVRGNLEEDARRKTLSNFRPLTFMNRRDGYALRPCSTLSGDAG